MVALVQAQDYAHWDLGIFKSHFVRHAATCHTDNSKIIQKAVKDSVRLHAASVSSFLTLTSLTELFLPVFPGETATACYSNVVWMRLENDQSCRSTSAWLRWCHLASRCFAACLLAMNRHGLPWPASRQGIGPSSCTT